MRLGPWEIALLVIFFVVLFGARKIPEIMRGVGLGIREFKKGLHDNDKEDTKINQDNSAGSDKDKPV